MAAKEKSEVWIKTMAIFGDCWHFLNNYQVSDINTNLTLFNFVEVAGISCSIFHSYIYIIFILCNNLYTMYLSQWNTKKCCAGGIIEVIMKQLSVAMDYVQCVRISYECTSLFQMIEPEAKLRKLFRNKC